MASNYKLFWTETAINNLEAIFSYLSNNWTRVEIEKFQLKLSRYLNIIQKNPYLFPNSQYNSRLRKATLSKHVIVFYEIIEDRIYLVYIFNTKQNISIIT